LTTLHFLVIVGLVLQRVPENNDNVEDLMIYIDEVKPVAAVIWFLSWLLGDLIMVKGWISLLNTELIQHASKGAVLGLSLMLLLLSCMVIWAITSYKLISRLRFAKK
jgi:hypothetical protein